MQARVSSLKQQLEHLFPGKWLSGNERTANLQTGLPEIDGSISNGIARKRICEWMGPVSSGKTSLLKAAIANWCAAGLNVAYIDAEGKLFAADWAFSAQEKGKLWIVRPLDKESARGSGPARVSAPSRGSGPARASVRVNAPPDESDNVVPLVSKRALLVQEALWSADQFVRSNAFDVVILDFAASSPSDGKRRGMAYTPVSSRIYARLQRALDRSKSALIIVRDVPSARQTESWGACARFNFDWGTQIHCEPGLSGTVMITPAVKCQVVKDGFSQNVEVKIGGSVKNRLFTHPQVPDRRTSKG